MKLRLAVRDVPTRLATGAYILHSGLEKWNGPKEQAEGVHGMASSAFPFLKSIPPGRFLRLLAGGEVLTGTLLVAPCISNATAGAALTGFAGSLVGLYSRTSWMHRPGSIWPEQAGIAVSKDVWMLGIGLGLLAAAATTRKSRSGGTLCITE